jgi:flagellar hook-associated protein 2
MSTTSPTTVGTSAGTLSTASSTSPLQITGLASGLNTNAIIQAELAESELPITNMQTQVAGLQTMDNTLSAIQSSLTTVQLDAQALGDPTLFNPTQAVSSSDSSLVTAASTNGVGGVVGGSVVTVANLASAAQRTFTFTSPTSAGTSLKVDGVQVAVQALASGQDLANSINSNSNMDVWAAATSGGQIVLSERTTGDATTGPQGSNFIQVTDANDPNGGPSSTLAQAYTGGLAVAQNGEDAQYTINGKSGSSATDTVTDAIPGVTLTLNGVTGSNPVTVNVQQPTANTQAIEAAVNQFVTDYNSTLSSVQSAVATEPANSANGGTYNPDAGSLYGDTDLSDLLNQMRTSMYTPGSTLPAGMAALTDIGIGTGASTGSVQQSSLTGQIVVNQTQLEQAIQSNPNGVEQILQKWSQSFNSVVENAASPVGVIAARVSGNGNEITSLSSQITTMQARYAQQQKDMQAQWAQVEATLSQLQSQGSAFSSSYSASTTSSSTG